MTACDLAEPQHSFGDTWREIAVGGNGRTKRAGFADVGNQPLGGVGGRV